MLIVYPVSGLWALADNALCFHRIKFFLQFLHNADGG